jgi:hypothetical protein
LRKRETVELVSAYYRIDDPVVRRRLLDLAEGLAQSGEQPRHAIRQRSEDPQFQDEGEAAAAFTAPAAELLNTVEDTLAEMRRNREETRSLLDCLDARLAQS